MIAIHDLLDLKTFLINMSEIVSMVKDETRSQTRQYLASFLFGWIYLAATERERERERERESE
jgi:hypothetical protein